MHCVSSNYAMADYETHGEADGSGNTSMGSSQQQSTYKWTDEDTQRLIKWRARNEDKFTGKRNAAMKGFEMFIQEHGLEGKVKAGWAKKKWENLKQKYKEVKAPRTGVNTEGGEATAANWKWFDTMDKVIGRRPSITPPNLISSAMALTPDEDVKTRASSLQTQYSGPITPGQRRILQSCKFLTKHVNHCSTESNLDHLIKESSDSESENRELSQDLEGGESPSHTESSSVSPPPPQPAKKRSKTQSRHDMKRQKLALLQHLLDVIQETSREPETDCEDSFGVTVAMELKRIRNLGLRNRVKRQIMTILYDALDCEQPDTLLYQPLPASPREESHSITVVLP
ncbi:uncharacterized protein LOC122971204 [Thunnus albacares]|uniref:uncharacterized protein LOC122971204 n=1 Tax=Thunnus albacares TaxID=8236 RepID=UPI001CF70B22|nr:uncharacterized protein LOC122971204 [Thunnus albacares]